MNEPTDLTLTAFAAAGAQLDEYGTPLNRESLRIQFAMMWLAGRGEGLLEGKRIADEAFAALGARVLA